MLHRALGLVLAVAPLLGCGATAPAPATLGGDAVLLAVPDVRQERAHECGLAALVALCWASGATLAPEVHGRLEEVARAEGGLPAGELVDAVRAAGLDARLFRGRLDRSATGLYRHLDAGRPVLVRLGLRGSGAHYACVRGYDPGPPTILVLDPERGGLAFEAGAFDRAWERGGRLALVAPPPPPGTEPLR